jgi:hypothetical protein
MSEHKTLQLSELENWLWEAACVIRGAIDAPKFKDYILPLLFLKRLSDVYEDELHELGKMPSTLTPITTSCAFTSLKPRAGKISAA